MWDLIQSNKRKSVALIFFLAVVLIALGYFVGFYIAPGDGGLYGAVAAMLVWTIMMAASVGGGEAILLASSGAREVDHNAAPQLFNIVEEMKIAAGLPAMPRVFIIDSDVPNAFAVGLNPKRAAVAVTTGLLSRLNRDELQGVIAHEIGHIANRDTLFMTLAGVTVGAVIIIADLFLRGLFYGGGRTRRSSSRNEGQGAAIMAILSIILAILAPILAQILYFACSRRREYLADASSAQFTRYPEGLATALEKISGYHGERLQISRAVAPMMIINPLAAAGSSTSIFSTHPATEDRIRVLRSMAGGSSFAAYDQAFRSAHGDHGVIGSATLRGVSEFGVRKPSDEPAASASQQMRSAKNILHNLNQLSTIACSCGLKIKLPPGFDHPSLACPRCGAQHVVPPELLAAAAALQAAGGTPGRPPSA